MTTTAWLDQLDPWVRRALLALTLGSLVVGTVLLEQLDYGVLVLDAIALGWLGALALLWAGARWRAQPRVRAQRLAAQAAEDAQLHERGLLIGGAVPDGQGGVGRLLLEDPSLSLPDTLQWAWLLYTAAQQKRRDLPWIDVQVPLGQGHSRLGGLRAVGVTRRKRHVYLNVVLTTVGPDGDAVPMWVTLERPAGATSVAADDLSHLDRADREGDWHLVRAQAGEVPTHSVSTTLASDLRALHGRNPTVDQAAIEERVRSLVAELSEGALDRLGSRCTETGAACIEVPRTIGDDDPIEWLEADSDAVYERVELRHRGLVVGLCRPVGTEDDWLLWRLDGGLA